MSAPPGTPDDGRGIQVDYAEMGLRDGSSPSMSADLETQTVTRRLRVAWNDYQDAVAQLLGFSYLDDEDNMVRYLPQEDWEFPGLVANRVTRVEGLAWQDKVDGEFGSNNIFQYAGIEVQFGPRPYDILDSDEIESEFDRYLEVETTVEGDYLSLPNAQGQIAWSEGTNATTPFPGTIGRIVCFENYVFRWHQIPDEALPEGAILKTVGHVNKEDFGNIDNPRLFFPAGTMLMLGAAWRRIFMAQPGGVSAAAWTIEMMFKYNANGHNKFFDFKATPPGWYQVSNGGTFFNTGSIPDGKCVYDEADYDALFNV